MGPERRNLSRRGAIVQRVIEIVQDPSVILTVNTMQQRLGVPKDAAERILDSLASSGLVKEVHKGTWARGTLTGYGIGLSNRKKIAKE